MSNTKFTPRPWEYFLDTQDGDKFTICTEDKEYIASTYALQNDDGGYIENANADLIAAAPDMYEALKSMVENFWAGYNESEKNQFRYSYPNNVIIKAESALSKANPQPITEG